MKIKKLKGYTWCPVFFQIDLKDVTLKIKDGTPVTPNEIDIKIGEGNFTYTEARNIEYTLDRGLLDEVREGDEIPVDVSFDFVWEFITNGTGSGVVPSIEDALKQKAAAAAWVSTDADGCRPYAVDLELVNSVNCGSSSNPIETITIQDFRYESLDHDLRAGTVAVSGRANVTEADAVRS
jgi:hypothetical protein